MRSRLSEESKKMILPEYTLDTYTLDKVDFNRKLITNFGRIKSNIFYDNLRNLAQNLGKFSIVLPSILDTFSKIFHSTSEVLTLNFALNFLSNCNYYFILFS